ncbi:perlucin-like protein [Ptychodera flava]|uniref:perlucin-like protein n=1 Tax=Ptychodera flava TaxID=63121 RepID=UPI003969E3E3
MMKMNIIASCLLASVILTAACHSTRTGCPSGWIQFRQSCYYIYDYHQYTFEEAETVCQATGSTLVIIDDAEENLFLKGFTRHVYHLWIGLTDIDVEGKWVWADGSPLKYSNWNHGEPNNAGGIEDCAHFWSSLDGRWNDYPCSARLGFICERKVSK